MLTYIGNRLIFPAPRRSYQEDSYPDALYYIPWDYEVLSSSISTSSTTTSAPSSSSTSPPNTPPNHFKTSAPHGVPVLFYSAKELSGAKTVFVYFHGNAEDIGMSQAFVKHIRDQFRVNVLSVEYPGYGLLDGMTANEENLYLTGLNVLRFVNNTPHLQTAKDLRQDEKEEGNRDEQLRGGRGLGVRYQNIILVGRSIGSGPACWLAAKYPVGGLILVSPFATIKTAVKSITHGSSLLERLASFLLTGGGRGGGDGSRGTGNKQAAEKFDNLLHIHNVRAATLIIHGKRDVLIPTEHSLELYSCSRADRKKFVTPTAMEHNSNLFAEADFFAIPCLQFFNLPGMCAAKGGKGCVEMPRELLAGEVLARRLAGGKKIEQAVDPGSRGDAIDGG